MQLAITVNVLSALLALAGLLGYVFVYTIWLKPLTPQNIVIGGAAGAMPPPGRLGGGHRRAGAEALYPFGIVFLDPAPLLGAVAADQGRLRAHGRADAPVVKGEAATRRQIVAYALVLVAFTLIPVATGFLGALYLAAALVLGGGFVALAVRLLRTRSRRACATSPRSRTSPCSSARWPWTGPSDRTAAVDRSRAAGNIGAGLLTASIALVVFGLCFVIAIVYIG